MVNSPSRPNLRPVAPPPLGASVRLTLPLPHPGIRPRPGRGQFEISNLRLKSPSYRWPSARTIKPQSRQKPQQSRLIVPNQGKRQKTNITIQSANGAAPYQPRATPWVWPPHDTSPERAAQPSIKAKTPAIVPHQGKSSLIKSKRQKIQIPSCHRPAIPTFATPRLRAFALNFGHQASIKAKTPAIKPYQGKSRHPLKSESTPHDRAIPTRHALLPPA